MRRAQVGNRVQFACDCVATNCDKQGEIIHIKGKKITLTTLYSECSQKRLWWPVHVSGSVSTSSRSLMLVASSCVFSSLLCLMLFGRRWEFECPHNINHHTAGFYFCVILYPCLGVWSLGFTEMHFSVFEGIWILGEDHTRLHKCVYTHTRGG